MLEGLLLMSAKKIERVGVIKQTVEKDLSQREACQRLKLSKRQVIRLVKKYRQKGPSGFVSGDRGRASKGQHSETTKCMAKQLVQARYADFGPRYAVEKLLECHQLRINKETLRQWMVEWSLWKARRPKKLKSHGMIYAY